MFKYKKLSILGDSISTYKGVSDDASANLTLLHNPYSWSGGNLSGKYNPDSSVNRANNLSRDDGCVNLPDQDIIMKKQTESFNDRIASAVRAA